MAEITDQPFADFATGIGNGLSAFMNAGDIQPGHEPSYQMCKQIYLLHPLGAKLVEAPIKLAMSKPRIISLKDVPCEDELTKAFQSEWESLQADYYIFGARTQSRIYGTGALGFGIVGESTKEPVDFRKTAGARIYFSVFDPLNTAGSLVLDQDPNSPLFQKHGDITVSGKTWHRSRTVVMFNEQPIYIAYTSSAFGFAGRSVYQRVLYPLKSFIASMQTDDMVTRKAGLLIAKIKAAGAIINKLMQAAAAIKRSMLRQGVTNQVLSIDPEEAIETLNMQNADTAMTTARGNIINNIAAGSDTPAQLLKEEGFAEGFGEGTEDTKHIMRYGQREQNILKPLYDLMDRICMHRAWSPEFFEALKAEHPDEYGSMDYDAAFLKWQAAFTPTFATLFDEPDSEKAKHEKEQVDGVVAVVEKLGELVSDPVNKANIAEWIQNTVNRLPHLFPAPLTLDIEAIETYVPPVEPGLDADIEPDAEGGEGTGPKGARSLVAVK